MIKMHDIKGALFSTGSCGLKKNNEKDCYLLDSLKTVNHETDIESITFSDTEYRDFLSGILADLKNN